MIRMIIITVLALSCVLYASEQQAAPTVTIKTPNGGQSSKRMVEVSGTISDTNISRAYIVINSSANLFDVSGGQFKYSVVLAPGENVIQILAENEGGLGRDTIVIHSQVPKRDVKILMTWDTATDIDLHVIDPSGEETYYSSKESKIGGQLDHDDTNGFGPETFMLSNAINGKYIVKSKYYGGSDGQTRVKITVVLFEGTSKESRIDYYRLLSKKSEFVEVCSFSVQQ
ncbi:YfaP family protein [Candidatus Uabimicrobium sp. HlEnr_7]|uniref:YfaP family protein n=1 Tax=Candidatus Uabimicrobium helgolandensis TaxID=3095367 RepID=UPI0035577333